MFSKLQDEFISIVDNTRAHVVHLPAIIFVYGGAMRPTFDAPSPSMRDTFVNWAHDNTHKVAALLHMPEEYPEWNQFNGYDDLVEFERDAGCLSRAILLFLESPGGFAELGAFCVDPVLAERLFIVLYSKFYRANSFIDLGPLRLLKRVHGEFQAICPVDGSSLDDLKKVAADIANEVLLKSNRLPKQQIFDPIQVRDQLLLIADLVELFGALSKSEIKKLLEFFNINLSANRLEQVLNLLCLLNVIKLSDHLTRVFFTPPKSNRESFISFKLIGSESQLNRVRFKFKAIAAMKHDSFRRQAYEKVHGQ